MRNTAIRFLSAVLQRMLLPLMLCLGLSGCMVISTNQENTLPKPPPTPPNQPIAKTVVPRPPVEMAFIVHLSHKPQNLNNHLDEAANEARAWNAALGKLTLPEHILIAGPNAAAYPPEFAAFCRTHPLVEIDYHTGDFTFMHVVRGLGGATINMASMGWIPLPMPTPYVAQFSLTLPGKEGAAGGSMADAVKFAWRNAPVEIAHLEYRFDRHETFAPYIILPIGDENSLWLVPPCQGCRAEKIDQYDRTDWRIEEKRRLLAQFLREIAPQLEHYVQLGSSVAGVKP
jgi:hypothetical protein